MPRARMAAGHQHHTSFWHHGSGWRRRRAFALLVRDFDDPRLACSRFAEQEFLDGVRLAVACTLDEPPLRRPYQRILLWLPCRTKRRRIRRSTSRWRAACTIFVVDAGAICRGGEYGGLASSSMYSFCGIRCGARPSLRRRFERLESSSCSRIVSGWLNDWCSMDARRSRRVGSDIGRCQRQREQREGALVGASRPRPNLWFVKTSRAGGCVSCRCSRRAVAA